MKVRDLRLRMEKLLGTLLSSATEDALEVQSFLAELEKLDECELAEVGFSKRKVSKRSTTKVKRGGLSSEGAVAAYVNQLKEAATDAEEVNTVVGRLLADRALKAADVAEVANAFRGVTARYKSKLDAANAIKSKALDERRGLAQRQRIRDIF